STGLASAGALASVTRPDTAPANTRFTHFRLSCITRISDQLDRIKLHKRKIYIWPLAVDQARQCLARPAAHRPAQGTVTSIEIKIIHAPCRADHRHIRRGGWAQTRPVGYLVHIDHTGQQLLSQG